MIRRPPRSTQSRSSAASDVYKRQTPRCARRTASGSSTSSRTSLRPVHPELDLGPVTLQTFGISFAFGFLGAGAVLGRRFTELGKPVDWAYEMIFAGLIGGLLGSRLDYLIQNYDSVSCL